MRILLTHRHVIIKFHSKPLWKTYSAKYLEMEVLIDLNLHVVLSYNVMIVLYQVVQK